MARPLVPGPGPDGVTHRTLPLPDGVEGSADWFGVACHGFDITHVDAVGHSALNGLMYQGVPFDEGYSHAHGLASGAIDELAGGIVTRGVLLDVAETRGVDYLAAGDVVTKADLDAAERLSGVTVERGDAIFVRTGFDVAGRPARIPDAPREGLGVEAVEWIRDREVGVYSGDCIERLPSQIPGLPMPLHQLGHVFLGLIILDNPDVERLRARCRELNRSTFLLMVAVLPIRGGTGSPVNPLAVF